MLTSLLYVFLSLSYLSPPPLLSRTKSTTNEEEITVPIELSRSISVDPSFLSDPIDYAMTQLRNKVNSLKALEKRVETTGVRDPCPVKGGQILDFEAYMTWSSYPHLYEPEEQEEENTSTVQCVGHVQDVGGVY